MVNYVNARIEPGHDLTVGHRYALKRPDYEGDDLVPYSMAMFAFELPANFFIAEITNSDVDEYGDKIFEFRQVPYEPQVADNASQFRGLAQPYESAHTSTLRRRRGPGQAPGDTHRRPAPDQPPPQAQTVANPVTPPSEPVAPAATHHPVPNQPALDPVTGQVTGHLTQL